MALYTSDRHPRTKCLQTKVAQSRLANIFPCVRLLTGMGNAKEIFTILMIHDTANYATYFAHHPQYPQSKQVTDWRTSRILNNSGYSVMGRRTLERKLNECTHLNKHQDISTLEVLTESYREKREKMDNAARTNIYLVAWTD